LLQPFFHHFCVLLSIRHENQSLMEENFHFIYRHILRPQINFFVSLFALLSQIDKAYSFSLSCCSTPPSLVVHISFSGTWFSSSSTVNFISDVLVFIYYFLGLYFDLTKISFVSVFNTLIFYEAPIVFHISSNNLPSHPYPTWPGESLSLLNKILRMVPGLINLGANFDHYYKSISFLRNTCNFHFLHTILFVL
jgi:hypothetical protein